ncbi:BPI fold-containing family B member 2 [Melospiza georgiana]|uniref:BPI fold-containing family B member 2 n=1 Tax=Melospiza georgiana TaxID=44398 RepID=UPI0025AD18D2|nr:BPI fold-containing family B member 2 [Melospiza georgiana]
MTFDKMDEGVNRMDTHTSHQAANRLHRTLLQPAAVPLATTVSSPSLLGTPPNRTQLWELSLAHHSEDKLPQHLLFNPSPRQVNRQSACMAMLRTLSVLLSLLVPAHSTRSPDCGGILTPSGLRYLAEVSKPHAESVLRRDLMDSAPAPSPTSPSRNQIISVKVDKFSLTLIPDTGMRLSIEVDLGISSAPSSTKEMRLSILADLHVDMNPEGNLELVTSDCKPTLEEVQSAEETDSKSSSSDVDKQINVEKICLEVSKLLLFPNERLMSLAAPFPITPNCQVQYLPLAAPMYSEQGIIISLQTTFQVAGAAIPLPVSPVPFSMPEPARSSPSHLILAFSEHFYTSLFSALEESGALNVSLLSSLTTATLAERITQMGSLFQEDLPVVLQAVTRSSPHVVLEEDKAIVQLFLTAQIGAGSSPFQSFLSVNVDVTARLQISVADTRMIISVAAVEDIELSLATSDVGPILAALLEELFLPTLREEVPAQINKVLRQGVFLPHIASFTYTDVNITIHKDYVLIPCNLQLEAKTGEARTWE